ncbi:hypothetical protein [Shewanella violacea]|uniref:Uncharacterized protein n=1 Tax=Shewanella violacea (strain JCM 10179 / CIP 106290 / LMG 19151 / DSS12) TaxID=637905 RepID=D4ZB24_SHEVD|nr:hypothetical protein [Shewanella violacea]BAJ03219.1 hypothetical protein SVI_3248 [Shewanella violacea DSS12]
MNKNEITPIVARIMLFGPVLADEIGRGDDKVLLVFDANDYLPFAGI